MKKLYEYTVDFGRMGSIEGRFVCDESELKKIIGPQIYLGEALGKHSEIYFNFESEDDFKVVTDNQEFLKMAEKLNISLSSGYDPFDYIQEEEE